MSTEDRGGDLVVIAHSFNLQDPSSNLASVIQQLLL